MQLLGQKPWPGQGPYSELMLADARGSWTAPAPPKGGIGGKPGGGRGGVGGSEGSGGTGGGGEGAMQSGTRPCWPVVVAAKLK